VKRRRLERENGKTATKVENKIKKQQKQLCDKGRVRKYSVILYFSLSW